MERVQAAPRLRAARSASATPYCDPLLRPLTATPYWDHLLGPPAGTTCWDRSWPRGRIRLGHRHGDQHGAQHPATSPRVGSVGRPGLHCRRDLVDHLHQFLVREPEAHGAVPGAVPLEVDVAGADVPIDIGQHTRRSSTTVRTPASASVATWR